GEQHGLNAIVDVKIGFTLVAVPQNVQPIWIFSELLHKIENVPVAITLPQDRYKAKYAGLEAITFSVGRNHSLAGQLRGTVKRGLHGKGGVLRGRHDRCLTIDRAARREGDLLDIISAHRFQHIECRDGVLLEVFTGGNEAETYVSICCKMHDAACPAHRVRQAARIEEIALDKREMAMSAGGDRKS